jgi:hypothetical protein
MPQHRRRVNARWRAGRFTAVRRPVQLRQEPGDVHRRVQALGLARRRLVVAWLLVAVVGLAAGGKGISALSRQSAS